MWVQVGKHRTNKNIYTSIAHFELKKDNLLVWLQTQSCEILNMLSKKKKKNKKKKNEINQYPLNIIKPFL
jgi:hypothetical protein